MMMIFAESSGFQAISEGQGVTIAVTGMLIVFFALAFISLFLRLLPVVLGWMEPILPRLESHAQPPTPAERLPAENERLVAAIGYVLRMEMEKAAQSK
jgi:Na+-transporting methylmalonyl-CoA/oxaloacetate decarboxylase gamma subunit